MLMTVVRRLPVVLFAFASAALAGVFAAGAAGRPPTGNAQGLALLARVHRAYERVPAIMTTARFGGVTARFTLLLRDGIAVGEQYLGETSTGTTILVARGSGPTYAREPGTGCWRRLLANDPQSLEDIGLRFPDAFQTDVGAPTRSGSEWLLPVRTEGRSPGGGGSGTMHISATSLLVDSESVRLQGRTLTDDVRALRRQPHLSDPRPRC